MKDGIYLIEMGKKIRDMRKSKGVSMRQFIKICPLQKSAISEIENGKRNSYLLTLKLIADTLKCDVKDFL